MNWLGIRTWAPAVRHATNGLNQGTVAVRTGLTSAARYPFVLQREKKKPPVWVFRTERVSPCPSSGCALGFPRIVATALVCVPPSPRDGRISFSGHSVPNSRNRKAPGRFLVYLPFIPTTCLYGDMLDRIPRVPELVHSEQI